MEEMFENLEKITERQKDISNYLLSRASTESIYDSKLSEKDRKRREKQSSEFVNKLVGESIFDHGGSYNVIAKQWLEDELYWVKNVADSDDNYVPEKLIYRVLALFLRNHTLCPFIKEEKSILGKKSSIADNNYFENLNLQHYRHFANEILKVIPSFNFEFFNNIASNKKNISDINIDQELFSARYKLLGKDFDLLKGLVIGGTVGVITSFALGPVIGTWIGEAAGLYGAAATNYGLALLGGGSLASGGFGMAGGSVVLGIAFGGSKATYSGIKGLNIELLELTQALKNLPILLAVGRILKEMGCEYLPSTIAKLIFDRYQESERKYAYLYHQYKEDKEKEKEKQLQRTTATYKAAWELAKDYSWVSGYEVYRKVVKK